MRSPFDRDNRGNSQLLDVVGTMKDTPDRLRVSLTSLLTRAERDLGEGARERGARGGRKITTLNAKRASRRNFEVSRLGTYVLASFCSTLLPPPFFSLPPLSPSVGSFAVWLFERRWQDIARRSSRVKINGITQPFTLSVSASLFFGGRACPPFPRGPPPPLRASRRRFEDGAERPVVWIPRARFARSPNHPTSIQFVVFINKALPLSPSPTYYASPGSSAVCRCARARRREEAGTGSP